MELELTRAEARLLVRALQRQAAEDRKYAEGQRTVRRNEFNDNAEAMERLVAALIALGAFSK